MAALAGIAIIAAVGAAAVVTSDRPGEDVRDLTSGPADGPTSATDTAEAGADRITPRKPDPDAAEDAPALTLAVDAVSEAGHCRRLAPSADAAVAAVETAMDNWGTHVFAQDEYDDRTISFAAAELVWQQTRLAADDHLAAVDQAVATFDQARAGCSEEPDEICRQRLDTAETVVARGQLSLDQWRVHLADIEQSSLPGHSRHVAWLDVWAEAKPDLLAWPASREAWADAPACV